MNTTTTTSPSQVRYAIRRRSWLFKEAVAVYPGSPDALLKQLQDGALKLSRQIASLPELDRGFSSIEESRLVFALEALLDIRRELMNETLGT